MVVFGNLAQVPFIPHSSYLKKEAYLISEQVEGKKVYTITETGRQLLAERGDPQDWMTRKNKPQQWMELGNAIADLGGLVMQVARSGNADHINRVREILSRAKREIYTILAQEE
jgi:DNA-binding PadR family transcriptional regulator